MNGIAASLVVALVAGGQIAPVRTDTSPHAEHFVQVNGVKLEYLDWGGKGEPLVLLTGYGATAHTFDTFAPRLTTRFHVLAFTRRGLPPSDRPSSGYDLATLTGDLDGFLDALGLRRVHLVAHSFGGAEMTQFATLHPERVASVVYLDAALDAAVGQTLMKDAPFAPPQAPPGSPYAQVNEWWTSYSPDFSKLKCPALAFYAIQDHNPNIPKNATEEMQRIGDDFWRTKWTPMVRKTADRFQRETRTGRVVILEHTGHYLFKEREDEVVHGMDQFYASLRATGGDQQGKD